MSTKLPSSMNINDPILERPPWLARMQNEGIDMVNVFDVEDLKLKSQNSPYIVQSRRNCKSPLGGVENICAQLPIFGGTTPTTVTVTTDPKTTTTDPKTTTTDPKTTPNTPDPLAELQADPKKLQDLLAQVTTLQSDLSKVTKDHGTLQKEKDDAARAQMGKEEQLQTDLNNAQEIIQKMDRVIRHTALTNAILENGDYQWHSVRQMMAELDATKHEVQIDLEGGKATVTGVDNEVKRIAQQCPWLLKSTAGPSITNGAPAVGRPSGAPPAGPRGSAVDKSTRRANLIGKFSAIGPR